VQVGAERDRVRDEVGAARAERPRVVPAATVADQPDAPSMALGEPLHLSLDALDRVLRAADIGDKAARGGPVAKPV
jgi:hypothetical protein